MSLTRPWRALVRLAAVPTAVLGLATLHSGGTFHPGTAPVQEAVLGRALIIDRLHWLDRDRMVPPAAGDAPLDDVAVPAALFVPPPAAARSAPRR